MTTKPAWTSDFIRDLSACDHPVSVNALAWARMRWALLVMHYTVDMLVTWLDETISPDMLGRKKKKLWSMSKWMMRVIFQDYCNSCSEFFFLYLHALHQGLYRTNSPIICVSWVICKASLHKWHDVFKQIFNSISGGVGVPSDIP